VIIVLRFVLAESRGWSSRKASVYFGAVSSHFVLGDTDPNKIIFSNVQIEKLKLSKKMNGGEIVKDKSIGYIALFGLLSDLQYDTFTYECSVDTLKYMPPFEKAKPLLFKRVP
jgi:hypothetical protein